ncbi:MAG TPA: hypothetical protein VEC99_10505, partial [Clostridia bacterium]|nr:hypothetical protein [Clostridia bacterium]
MAALHPGRNPAGHALETRMVAQLRRYFEVRSVGVLPVEPMHIEAADPQSGVNHDLLLQERAPELLHRLNSLRKLKAQYCSWRAAGWEPDMVLVYNLSPIYNQFLLWLRRQPQHPKLVLMLLDSANLGQRMPRLKQLRRRLKPMYVPDQEMLPSFDACVGLSRSVEHYFQPRQVPFMWMPGACAPSRALNAQNSVQEERDNGPLQLGYFGALGAHAGVEPL